MFAKIFKPPNLTRTFTDDFLFATDRISSYEYTKRWTKSGNFTLVFPFDKEILNALNLNGIIYIDGDWLFIQNVSYNGRQITVTGKDCKAFLETRIALPNNTGYTGYSSVSGSTSHCIEYYLNLNCINPADESRKLPLIFAGGTAGLPDDNYMARFEYLSDIVTAMCENAGIGFDVRGNIADRGFKFYLLKGVDRSFNVDEVSQLVATTASGISRRECNVNAGISHTDSWFEKYALKEIKDNVKTESFDIAVPFSNYGTDYELGDIVTVKDDFAGGFYNRAIAEVAKSYSSGQRSISLVLGIPKQKPVQKLVNNLINKTQQRK